MATAKLPKILVVEDETFLVKIYSIKLKKEGFDVHIAMDGEEAVKMAAEVNPDLILLDLILPKLNGFEALEKIRAQEATKKTPVIVLSNLGHDDDQKRGVALGVTAYLIKANSSIQDVIQKIRDVLEKK
jgi:two-component system, OmpR family, phosphate regulon response regulator PhoB